MPLTFENLDALRNHGFDALIDVRSPAEFAEDHIPGAINLPSLSNDERAEVGTMYVQESPFKARKIGASLVLQNVANHIAGPLQAHDGAWKPLVYCWRGGQRSGVFSLLLKEVGWRADNIDGGYQSYRRLVHDSLYETPLPHRVVLLDGNTGTAKTAILARLKARGVQTIDLEMLAGHRGSLLGAMPSGQPTQRMFESRLTAELAALDPDKLTIIEAESAKIGRINLPPQLWNLMIAAPSIHISASMAARSAFIQQAYAEVLADPETITRRLAPLRRLRGHATVDKWQVLQTSGDYRALAAALMEDHYDPAYAKSRRKGEHMVLAEILASSLNADGQDAVCDQIIAALAKV